MEILLLIVAALLYWNLADYLEVSTRHTREKLWNALVLEEEAWRKLVLAEQTVALPNG